MNTTPGMSDEDFKAVMILFVGLGSTPGIASLAGLLALTLDRNPEPPAKRPRPLTTKPIQSDEH